VEKQEEPQNMKLDMHPFFFIFVCVVFRKNKKEGLFRDFFSPHCRFNLVERRCFATPDVGTVSPNPTNPTTRPLFLFLFFSLSLFVILSAFFSSVSGCFYDFFSFLFFCLLIFWLFVFL
jgi:hypothetical protein